ncbi:Protein split ends [Camponotus japonicus]
MVRETRYLWVGNLPENIREDRIREHFKRYGRVQSVKLLPRGEVCPVDGGSSSTLGEGNEGGSGSSSGGSGGGGGGGGSSSSGVCATVAFMDIKSAAKAHAIEHTLDDRVLTAQYYEPQHLQHRFPSHGSSEDHGSNGGSGGGSSGTGGVSGGSSGSGSTGSGVGGNGGGGERGERGSEGFDSRGSHGSFYSSERSNRVVGTGSGGVVGGSGSGGGSGVVGVGGHPTDSSTGDPSGYISRRPPPTSSYHVTSSRARDRLYPRTGPYVSGPPPPPHLDRHRGSLPPSSWSTYEPTSSRYGSAPPPPSPATNDSYQDEQGGGGGGGSSSTGALRQHKKQRRKSRSGSSSPSGSSRSGSSSSSRSGSSGGSTSGGSTSPGSSPHRTSNVSVIEDRRPVAICVRNLPIRSSDSSLKDGLFHEYKKHGKVTWVKVIGTANERYALVCFRKPEDVEKALEVSQDKLFFGCKIEVAPYQGYDVEDNEFRPYEAELDEYHPKATRTLFIGNLEKDVTASELRKHFEQFGEIIEIDIKKQGAVSSYAFCQYSDIGSVVKAMRSMDGEHIGANRIKLGFGKSMPTPCVWVDGIGDCTSEKFLSLQFNTFGPTTQVVIDRERGHALVFFDQISCAQAAVKEMRGVTVRGRRLQIDFASRECQETFYEHLERQGNTSEKPWDSRPSPASSFDITIPSRRERNSFDSAVTVPSSSNRFTRYDTPPRSRTTNYSRTSGGSTPGASPAHPTALSRSNRRSYQDSYYDGDYAEPASRRFRSYDEFSQGSGASHDDYQSSVLSDGKLNDDDCPPPSRRHAVQSVVTSIDPPAPPPPLLPPPDIRHLQKERVHLLEQLEECHSSGDEVGFVSKKRAKLDNSSTTILCEDEEPEIASLLVTSHSSRKGMDFRRVSDSKVVVHHSTRRGSCEGRGPGPCKRRRDATSRHHEHHDGSRPGTPLVDERPENLIPSEPRRFRERSHEGPLSLPLPRFAAQMLNNNNNTSSSNNNNGSGSRSNNNASLAKIASPPCTSLSTAPSPRAAPQPPASPPPRHTSSSPTSSDSETAPQSPSLEERIRSLDEKYEKWSGSRALSAAGGDALAKLDASASERFRFRHKLLDLDLHEVQPSDIVKSVLAKRSVFDEDSKRLENFSEKYEPREFTGVIGVSSMIGSTAGLTSTSDGGCTSKVCLQYPFPSHPPIQPASGTSVTSQIGINTSLSASLTSTTTIVSSALKTDPRMVQHNCIHPTPATPITPGTSIKTVSPELPPVSLPIGLGTAASNSNGSGLASASSLLSSNGSIGNIHSLGTSTHRGLSISATTASPTVTAATDTFNSTAITTAMPVTTLSATTSSTTVATTTMSVTGVVSSMTITSSIAPPSSITSSSNSSSSSSLSASSTDLPRSRLRKETSGSNRENRDSRDGRDSRESKHSKGKDCQRRSRKDEIDVERNRKDRDEKESTNVVMNDVGNTDNHSKDFKDNKELRYERKEREEKERRDKDDRDRQERRDKEDRDRQDKKEKEERERREKDEERRERERLDKERQEKDRREREERERERKEREENEIKEKEKREKERIDRERREREEKERQERREREERERREREEREKKEREIRLEREKQEKERLRREREEQERREKEERDRIERERRREEKERLERERKREKEEKERLERERRKEKEEREKMEKEKREKEERERLEKLEREKHEREKRREREDQERREKEKAEREKRRDREEKDKEKRERDDNRRQSTENHLHPSVTQSQNQVTPVPVSVKRRCSSQDCPTDEDAKRIKLSDHRRDSKDRSRQNRRSEDRKHRNDSHRSSRESRESRDSKESSSATQDGESATRENNSRDSGNKEKQRSKKNRSEKESRERSPRVSHESDKEFLSRLELSKRNDSTLSEQSSMGSNHTRDVQHHQQQQSSTLNSHSDVDDGPLSTHEIQTVRNPSATDTDSDEPKKHSIFDIVDDEPAYISMYDKVKARSTKNMQKLEEEKRQVRLKDKFSQLKQSRARREEKKQSTSWDGDSVSSKALTEDEATSESDSTRTKSLSRKGSRSRIHSDTSEEEEPFNNKVRKPVKTERFLESDVDLGFADTEEKQNPLEASNVIVNSVHTNIKEEPRTSDEDERISVSFRTNHPTIVVNNHERDSRKKSHKKKQKRQKNSISSENNLKVEPTEILEHKNKTNLITSSNADCRPNHGTELTTITAATTIVTTGLENAEERMRADKKQRSKKDKRRDRNGEDKAKARRKRLNRQEARDSQRMEDIFGPLSDDVDDGPSNTHTFFNRFSNMTSENSVYASDSDGGRSSLDMDRTRRKTEKKRRHQPEDENSVDLAEAGREIEAKLLGMPSSPKSAPVCTTEPSDHDVFRFTDDNDSVEPSTPSTAPEKVKEKKKKRKKSKEERNRKDYHHHHHHHHHHHEKSGELPYLGAEPSPPRASSPLVSKTISSSLPAPRETLLSPIPKATSNVSTVSSITSPVVSDIQTSKSEKKKDKFIPGFGIEIDETIHENAVKSISEPDEKDSNCQSRGNREEPEVPVPTTSPAQNEDKPRVAISQEETEDAVAALLEETFGASTGDFSYEGGEEETETDGITGAPAEAPQEDVEEMQQAVESLNASTVEGDADLKPDTPQSEHDLQIDTDTEEDPNYETVDLTQPPKTPDIPSFYKSPTKTLNVTPVLTTPEKSIEMRLPPTVVTKPQSPPSSVIAHSWTLSEHNKPRESVKPVQLETTESDINIASPERTVQVQRTSASPPPQYKQPMLVPCSVPITSEMPKSLSVASSRPSPITMQPLYQRLPVSPQSQMVPMRQASPKMQTTTVSCSSSSNTTPLPPLVPSRIPPLVPSQSSPRISQPLSPNGQWSRNPALSPHVPNVGKRKASPPPTKIAVCVPIPAHRPEAPVQQIYSTAATQQPVIQHASGMLAPAPGYPRGGLPPLTLNIPPRPYMPVPPLASGIQVKNSRDSSLGGKSVIETLLPVNPNEPSQRLEEPKLSPAIIPEPTNKASTSPKVPSPNQPPTYIPETAKIEINASTSSPVFGKPAYVTDSYTMSSRTQKQISVSITTDGNLLSPRQKQEVSNLQLLTTHVPSTPSPVIVAHGQSHLLHKSVHTLSPPNVSSPNQSLIKTVVPIVPQQITSSAPLSVSGDKSVIPQTPCQRQSPVSQGQLVKSHIPLVSTESQTIITRVVSSTASSISTPLMNECLDQRIQGQQLEVDAEAQINQTAQPMQLTPPIQSTQPIDGIKQEPIDIKQEDTVDETEYNIAESEELLNQPSVENDVKLEKQEIGIKTEIAPCIPKVEVADVPVATKLETETPIKLEPVNEIKEEIKENDEMELDEEPVEDPLKEPSTDPLAIDSKEDPIDSKEDSDYWSAKEVNIESVIKKVDALCDGEVNDGDDEAQQNESANSDSHDTSKNESDWFDPVSSIEGESKKNFATTDEHDESMETCENESTRSRRGRAKSRRGSRGGVTTRRGGRNASTVSHRRGGRSSRGSKHHVEKNKLPADVYEFHDDSEEDNAGRPRLILTIKSPGPNVTGSNAQPAIPVAAVKEIPPEEFVSPAANTRKSRRLAERDGSRNTIDDVIEDVVRGSPANKGLVSSAAGNVHATRRSTRHNNAPRNTTVQPVAPLTTELRKSPRGNRKTARRTSENNEDSGEEKAKEVVVTSQEISIKEEPKPALPESPKTEEPAQIIVTSAPQKTVSLEPMTLIDPVTGMLIPMRESEEGQYIPVSAASSQVQTINRTPCEPRSSGLVNASSTNETPRVKSENSPLVIAESKKEVVIEHPPCQSTPTQPVQPHTSVITKPQSPTVQVQVTSTITIAQSSTTTTTIVTTVTATSVASTTTAQPTSCPSQTKPTSLKAHVLNASKLVTSAQQQVVITKPVAPSLPNQAIVQNIVKSPAQAIQGLNLQIPPGRVVSPSLSPRAKQAAQLTPANTGVKQGQPMSPVLNNTGAPPNPKQHLLQAAKQQTPTIVNMSQKMPINMHPVSVNVTRMHPPVSQPTALKGINGQPHPLNPKTHLLQAVVPPIVTGSSSTQPHLVNPQPISTGSTRPPVPKTPATGTIEPQKVEVPMSGCIMMPTASPQSRSVPMPTYEAPLHGSTGATPPGGQYGLVPPHRSQSPPLPPPAHHHVNTSQNEVVNHYGGLTRGGELPPHYLHSQMLQYQYHLRAQQEALTAPRIAYHIPGTRSPHLPLDPKLETGIEDSHSPPLELRRGTRTPQDRTTDSPQVAQVYMLHGRLPPPPPQYNAGSNPSLPGTPAGARAGYYEPPPAHLRSQYPMAASEAPPEMGRAATPERCRKHHVVTPPPYASQVPPQADTFQMLLQRYPVMWQGLLALKNDQAAVQMHFVFGNPNVARDSLPCNSDGSTPPLRIAQRMRLEQTQVEGVARKMQTDNEHCMLLALPCGRDEVDVLQQSKNLQTGFIMYLQQKQAAGIVNIAAPGSQQPAYVVHIFPSCDFAHENLARIAPDLLHRVAKIAHLLIVIATV